MKTLYEKLFLELVEKDMEISPSDIFEIIENSNEDKSAEANMIRLVFSAGKVKAAKEMRKFDLL